MLFRKGHDDGVSPIAVVNMHSGLSVSATTTSIVSRSLPRPASPRA